MKRDRKKKDDDALSFVVLFWRKERADSRFWRKIEKGHGVRLKKSIGQIRYGGCRVSKFQDFKKTEFESALL